MKLRKINAVLSLVATILLLGHAVSMAGWMLSGGRIPMAGSYLPWALTGVIAAHVLICIYFIISGHKGAEKRKVRSYPKMNISTIVQRLSGVLMVVFICLHIAEAKSSVQLSEGVQAVTGATVSVQPLQGIHAVIPPLFYVLVMAHIAVSTVKAFITLGIGSAKFVKRADIVAKVLCAAVLAADIIGFYLHMC